VLIDIDRLNAYKKLLAMKDDPEIEKLRGHKITAPVKKKKNNIEELKKSYVRHLMHRQLQLRGDLT
jgi:hypothetical protein